MVAYADKQGKCGENVTYYFATATGTLTIEGEGPMDNYYKDMYRPWERYTNQIKNIIIQKGVTSIGLGAFLGCINLNEVTISSSVTSIHNSAFDGCRSLISLTIPNSVTSIGLGAFSGCIRLTSISISNSVTEIKEYVFSRCQSLTAISIPNKVTTIGANAFSGCSNLTSVTIPNSVTSIGRSAFRECTSLTSIIIPNSVTSVEESAFRYCVRLISVTFLNSATTIGDWSFYNCPLEQVGGDIDVSQVGVGNDVLLKASSKNSSFANFASSYIQMRITQWQEKGEFETTQQYQVRVNETTRNTEVEKLKAEARQKFLDKERERFPKFTLGKYDADKQTFILSNDEYGEKTVFVNLSEAPAFKENFRLATFNPTFVINNDNAVLSDLGVSVNGKTYHVVDPVQQDKSADVAINLPPLEMDFGSNTSTITIQRKVPTDLTIDQNIPATDATNTNTFAVIIGNENYSMVAKVPYAKNDAQVLAEYCRKTLGMPTKNVRTYGDATYAMMMTAIKDIQDIAKAYDGNINVLFYYAGHGIPDEQNKGAYLLPVDADGRQTSFCYSVGKLYQELGQMNVNCVVVLMDACFSGALRGDGMLMSARSVAIKPKAETPQGKMVVLTAASGDETAYPYEEKAHGLFTYFLLKKLHDTKGGCTLGELSEYIKTNVQQQSVVVNRKNQTPTVSSSTSIADSWENIKLR